MKNTFTFFVTLFIFSFTLNQSKAQNIDPTFNLTAKNITTYPGGNGQDSIITFELWMQQTNQGQPNVNDLEYAACQFTFRYNKSIHSPGGNLIFGLVPAGCDLPPNLRPPTFQVDSVNGYLKSSGNAFQPLANYFISGTFPGSKILTMKIRTNKKAFNMVPLNLRFKLGPSPTTFISYFLPYPPSVDSTLFPGQTAVQLADTIANHYSVGDTSSHPEFSLISPGYNSSTSLKFINFSWHKANNAKSYKLQMASDLNFNNIVFSDSALIDTSITVNILNPDITYYWKVYAILDSSHYISSGNWVFNSVSAQVALNSPQNNATSVQLPVTFSWYRTDRIASLKPAGFTYENSDNIIFNKNSKININPGGFDFISNDTYKLEIAEDQNFSNIVFSDSAISDTFKTVSNLNLNTTYFWKVSSKNDSLFTVSSLTRNFEASELSLITPGNNSSTALKYINFSWHKLNNVKSYKLQVSTDLNFNNIVFSDSTLTDTSKTVSILNPDVTYYWKVYGKRDSMHYAISNTWNFNSVSAQVALYSPQNNATSVQLPVTFSWYGIDPVTSLKPVSFVYENSDNIIFNKNLKSEISSSGFDFISNYTYKLEIATDTNFNNVVFRDSAITDTFKTVSNLNMNTLYYWKVKSNNDSLFTVSSLTRNFRTLNSGGGHVFPTFNMTVKHIITFPNIAPNGAWRDSLILFDIYCQHTNFNQSDPFEYAASQFALWYNKAISGTGTLTLIKTGSSLPVSIQNPTVTVDTALGVLKASGNVPSSSANYFINSVFPGTKIISLRLRTTQNKWPVVPLNLRFKLGAAPNTFVAYLLPYPDTVDSNVNANQFAQNLLDTVVNVYSVDNVNFVLPVELANFVSNVNKNTVTLNWTTNKEINNQQFDIERSIAGSDQWTKSGTITGSGNSNETKNYTFTERTVTGHYSYRLKQLDYNGNYEYFNLNNEVVVGIPSAYSLSQNYPNPFNPSTKIDFELPEDTKVNVAVYDISGREVNSLVNEFKTAGYYTINFNASNLSSGIYFYMIKANDYRMTKKMVVVK